MSIRIKRAERDLIELNASFRKRKAFLDGERDKVYAQLESVFNIDPLRSELISWLPEGDGYCSCCIIDQNQNICFIEINVDDKDGSSCEKSSIEQYKSTSYFKNLKPWSHIRLAIEKREK